MRTAIILVILLAPLAAGLDGYCTGQYLERGPAFQDGYINAGDVFEYWCELPAPIRGEESFTVRLHYSNAELLQHLIAPRQIYGTSIVIYP